MNLKKNLPVENFSRNIAKQPNEFTQAIFKGTPHTYKLIIFALYQVIKKNPEELQKKSISCSFSKADFLKKMGIKTGSNTFRLIEQATKELATSYLSLQNENATEDSDIYNVKMPWFEKVETMKNGDVKLKFNQSIVNLFELKLGYSALDLLEIGRLQGFYAMRYYGLAKSKAGFSGKDGNDLGSWYFEYTESELRQLFEIGPEKYARRDVFVNKVIKGPCAEIERKTSIIINLEYSKIRKGEYLWRFVCSEKPLTFDQKDEKSVSVQNNLYTAICPVCGTRTSLFYPCVFCDFDMNDKDNAKLVNIKKQIFNMPKEKREMFEADCRAIESKILEKFTKTPGNLAVLEESKNLISAVYQKYNISE